ncbi:unnamed protein product, partial [Prorocentrum cordatum]
MESLTNATVAAYRAAEASAGQVGDGVSPFADRAWILWAAVQHVATALLLLVLEASSQMYSWAEPRGVVSADLGGPQAYVVYLALRGGINASWEKGLRDARVPSNDKAKHLWGLEAAEEPESEDEGGLGDPKRDRPAPPRLSQGRSMPSVAEATFGVRRQECSVTPAPGSPCIRAGGVEVPLLGQTRMLAELDDDECLQFLLEGFEIRSVDRGASVFVQGEPRDAFLVVKSGQVIVEASPPPAAAGWPSGEWRRGDEYTLEAGDTVVGLLFVLASLHAGIGTKEPPSVCRLHASSARAGREGAEVLALPTSRLEEAMDRFPATMQSMARRLCVRLTLVVFETLSTYFGLRKEVMAPSSYNLLDASIEGFADLPPSEIFARVLGWDDPAEVPEPVAEALAAAVVLERNAGEVALPEQQRATHVLVLLEGDLRLRVSPRAGSEDLGGPRRDCAGT